MRSERREYRTVRKAGHVAGARLLPADRAGCRNVPAARNRVRGAVAVWAAKVLRFLPHRWAVKRRCTGGARPGPLRAEGVV